MLMARLKMRAAGIEPQQGQAATNAMIAAGAELQSNGASLPPTPQTADDLRVERDVHEAFQALTSLRTSNTNNAGWSEFI
jgi:hypothetical protein